jgi:hypothetical protein
MRTALRLKRTLHEQAFARTIVEGESELARAFRHLGPGLSQLPPHHFCVRANAARIVFTSARFNDPGYAQLACETDRRVRELGPNDDAMGAFGFELEAHKWANLQVRLREFMPVGVRPLVVTVT